MGCSAWGRRGGHDGATKTFAVLTAGSRQRTDTRGPLAPGGHSEFWFRSRTFFFTGSHVLTRLLSFPLLPSLPTRTSLLNPCHSLCFLRKPLKKPPSKKGPGQLWLMWQSRAQGREGAQGSRAGARGQPASLPDPLGQREGRKRREEQRAGLRAAGCHQGGGQGLAPGTLVLLPRRWG